MGTGSGSPGPAPTAPRAAALHGLRGLPEVATAGSVGVQADAHWPGSLVSVGIPVASDEVVAVVAEQGRSGGFRPPLLADAQQTPEQDGWPGSGHSLALQPLALHPHASCGLGRGWTERPQSLILGSSPAAHLRPRGLVAVPLQAQGEGSLLKHSPWGDSPSEPRFPGVVRGLTLPSSSLEGHWPRRSSAWSAGHTLLSREGTFFAQPGAFYLCVFECAFGKQGEGQGSSDPASGSF